MVDVSLRRMEIWNVSSRKSQRKRNKTSKNVRQCSNYETLSVAIAASIAAVAELT